MLHFSKFPLCQVLVRAPTAHAPGLTLAGLGACSWRHLTRLCSLVSASCAVETSPCSEVLVTFSSATSLLSSPCFSWDSDNCWDNLSTSCNKWHLIWFLGFSIQIDMLETVTCNRRSMRVKVKEILFMYDWYLYCIFSPRLAIKLFYSLKVPKSSAYVKN